MSLISQYTFFQGFFTGPFIGVNLVDNTNSPFSQSSCASPILKVSRPNAEIVIDLGSLVNTNANVGLVATQLINAGATLTSGLRVQGVPWIKVPYFPQKPASHNICDMLIKLNFDFHVETPWFCSDIDGTISVFLFVFLDNKKHLKVNVDGTWFSFDGGGLCAGPAAKAFTAAMPGVKAQIASLLPSLISGISGNKFINLHFLPGNGTQALGGFAQNASIDLALGLLS